MQTIQSMTHAKLCRHVGWGLLSLSVLLSACDQQHAAESSASEQAKLDAGQVRVAEGALSMLDIQSLAQVKALPLIAMPAQVAFAEDTLSAAPAPADARVLSVHAHSGDVVSKGALLAVLLSADALQTRSDVSDARIAHAAAATELQRQRVMTDRGVGTDIDLRSAQTRLQETQQALSRAQGSAALLGQGQGDRLEVRAPRAGVVAQRNAVPGAAVEAGAALFMVGEDRSLGVTAQAYEADVAQLKPGAQVTVSLPQLTRDVPGTVRTIGAELDRETRRVPVFVTLQEAVPALRPGMLARVDASGPVTQDMVVPVSAVLIKDGNRSIVFVQRDKLVFEARDVRLGQPVRGVVPVLGGLSAQDRIVVRGGLLLDGAASQLM